jgi:hypothetical protein
LLFKTNGLYMDWSRHHVPGLRSFVLHLLILILFIVSLTLFLRMTATRNVVLFIYVDDIVIIVSDS